MFRFEPTLTPPWGPVLQTFPAEEIQRTVAGMNCSGISEHLHLPSLELFREIVRHGSNTFMRARLVNSGKEPLEPQRYSLFRSRNVDFDGVPAKDWMVYCEKRSEDKLPTIEKFSEIPDLIHYPSRKFQEKTATYGDPFLVIGNGKNAFLTGFLENDRHLTEIVLARRGELFEDFRADCLFQHAQLLPGKSWCTQWLVYLERESAEEAIQDFCTLLQAQQTPPAARKTPLVVSSWHYYGLNVCEKSVERELAEIQHRNLPANVYLIDGGWYDWMGDWNANPQKFPHGMKAAAERIQAIGLMPGLWFAPFQAATQSQLAAQHPEWILRHSDGTPVEMQCSQKSWLLDLSRTDVQDYLTRLFQRFSQLGFGYIKTDFTRYLYVDDDARPFNPEWNNLDLWREGMKLIRRAIGPEAYFVNCGGHSTAGLAICDSHKLGFDSYALWHVSPRLTTGTVLRSYLLRMWQGELWRPCGTALNFRLSGKCWDSGEHGRLRLGLFTDNEIQTVANAAFCTGGLVQIGDPLGELPEDRLALQSKVVPSIDMPSRPMELFAAPEQPLLLYKTLKCPAGNWKILSAFNLDDDNKLLRLELSGKWLTDCPASEYFISDAITFEALGVFPAGASFDCGRLPGHSSRIFQIFPLPNTPEYPFFVSSDVHLSGGAAEVQKLEVCGSEIGLTLNTPWRKKVQVRCGILRDGAYQFKTVEIDTTGRPLQVSVNFLSKIKECGK